MIWVAKFNVIYQSYIFLLKIFTFSNLKSIILLVLRQNIKKCMFSCLIHSYLTQYTLLQDNSHSASHFTTLFRRCKLKWLKYHPVCKSNARTLFYSTPHCSYMVIRIFIHVFHTFTLQTLFPRGVYLIIPMLNAKHFSVFLIYGYITPKRL